MLRSALSGGALTGFEKDGAQLKSAIDEARLIRIGGHGVEEPLEGDVDGKRGRVSEVEKGG